MTPRSPRNRGSETDTGGHSSAQGKTARTKPSQRDRIATLRRQIANDPLRDDALEAAKEKVGPPSGVESYDELMALEEAVQLLSEKGSRDVLLEANIRREVSA